MSNEPTTAADRGSGCNDLLGPVQGAVLDRNGWPTLIVRGNEEAHVKHAGASYLYTLTAEEVAAVNKLRARREWMKRETHRCHCDHNEYCEHCWPVSFRPGGVWHGLGAQRCIERLCTAHDPLPYLLDDPP